MQTARSAGTIDVIEGENLHPGDDAAALHRAFRFITDAGAYWSVVNDATHETVVAPDRFLHTYASDGVVPSPPRANTRKR